MRILNLKLGSVVDSVNSQPASAVIHKTVPQAKDSGVEEDRSAKILRDNPLLDRLIVVGTKALGRGLVSGETLRAPRQQLRQLRASAFDLLLNFQELLKSASVARLNGARCIFGSRYFLREPDGRILLTQSIPKSINSDVYPKSLIRHAARFEGDTGMFVLSRSLIEFA